MKDFSRDLLLRSSGADLTVGGVPPAGVGGYSHYATFVA